MQCRRATIIGYLSQGVGSGCWVKLEGTTPTPGKVWPDHHCNCGTGMHHWMQLPNQHQTGAADGEQQPVSESS